MAGSREYSRNEPVVVVSSSMSPTETKELLLFKNQTLKLLFESPGCAMCLSASQPNNQQECFHISDLFLKYKTAQREP